MPDRKAGAHGRIATMILGAHKNGIDSIAVAYGYGSLQNCRSQPYLVHTVANWPNYCSLRK